MSTSWTFQLSTFVYTQAYSPREILWSRPGSPRTPEKPVHPSSFLTIYHYIKRKNWLTDWLSGRGYKKALDHKYCRTVIAFQPTVLDFLLLSPDAASRARSSSNSSMIWNMEHKYKKKIMLTTFICAYFLLLQAQFHIVMKKFYDNVS